jgi:hypothetical protein
LKVRPSFVAPRTRDINFESDDSHKILQKHQPPSKEPRIESDRS